MITVLIPLAQGCEELEAVTLIDLLRRADIEVITVSLDNETITASRGVRLVADISLDDFLAKPKPLDLIVLPGGLPGADNLNNDRRIINLLQQQAKSNKYVAAICAAPKVLATAGILEGKSATAYPGILEKFKPATINISTEKVVIDGNIITSRGAGTAMDFALVLIGILQGQAKRKEVEAGLVR